MSNFRPILALRALAMLVALLVALPAWAVDLNSTIKGVVSDVDGLPVPGVELTLTSPNMLGDRTSTTDGDGRYLFTPLPPGVYTLSAAKKGFEDYSSNEFKIQVASTSRLDITILAEGQAQMEIEVIGAAPAVDTERVASGAVLDAEFLKDVPTGRDYQSATALAPGVVGGGNANVRGGFDSSNQFYIDGVNITDPMTNTFSANMNYDAIESLQVITGGMDAEYGRSLGGAINIVTKSGGNEFEGQAQLIYLKGPGMIIAPAIEEYGDTYTNSLEEQLVLNLGGPIKKDKVWFFASAQGDRLIRTISFDNTEIGRDLEMHPLSPRDWRSMYLFGKVTAQPTLDHRVWIQAQTDPTWIDNVLQDPFTLPSGEAIQNQGGWLGSVGHTWTPSDKLVVETQLYHQTQYLDFFSVLWKNCQEFTELGDCAHSFEGMEYEGSVVPQSQFGWNVGDFSAGEFPYASLNNRFRDSINSSVTWLGDFLGEHRLKAGFQAEMLRSKEVWPGIDTRGIPYYTYNPDLDPEGIGPNNVLAYDPVRLFQYDNPWKLNFGGNIVSWYAQDVYKPTSRLTIRPGIRFDYSAMRNEDDQTTRKVEKPEVIFSSLTVAPRMGVAYDLTGDGKTSAFAYYGRFYDSGFLILSALLQNTSQGYNSYGWNPDLGDWDYDNPEAGSASYFLAHDDLRNPYSDEIDIGMQREIAPGTAFGATFTYEEARRFWEDDEVNLIWNDEGTQVIGYRNGVNESVYRLRTPDDSFTRYTSLELTLAKQHTENWSFVGSYTWSRAYGTNSADQATANADIPEQRQYEIGVLDYDRTHAIKTSGSYMEENVARMMNTNIGYVFGWNFRMYSGLPYRPLTLNNYYGGFSNYGGPADGRYRLPAFSQTDIRAGLHLDMADRVRWMLGVDIFNLFNDRTATAVSWAYDPEQPIGESTFGDIVDRQDPRRLQITVRGEF